MERSVRQKAPVGLAAIRDSSNRTGGATRVLLIASSGGHWVQLNRLTSAFAEADLHFASTERDYRQSVSPDRFNYVPDASMSSSVLRIAWQAFCVLMMVLRVRPHLIVSTGAAPGYFALLFGRKLGARTVWVDSIANVEQISLAGTKAAKHADLFLTQWEHLACEGGPAYFGSVL